MSKEVLVDEELILGFHKLDVPRYVSWVLYDVANTFYASGILTLIIGTWILVIGQNNGFTYVTSLSVYNLILSIASIFMAIFLPILGAISDLKQERRNYVLLFSIICILSTAVFAYSSNYWVVLGFFAVSMIAYQWAQVFYDSMLPGVVPPGQEARYSSIAIALGYLGGLAITLYSYIQSIDGERPIANPDNGEITLGYLPKLIPVVILGFFLLTLPLLRVKETDWSKLNMIVDMAEDGKITQEEKSKILTSEQPSIISAAKDSFKDLYSTFLDIRSNNPGMFYYIIAYFIIADLANLIVLITSIYLRDVLNMEESEVFIILAVTGAGLIFLSYFIGLICDRWGAKRGFQVIGFLWITALLIFSLEGILLPRFTIYFAALLIGPALSGVWISQRQMVLELVPDEESLGKYFGLTKFSGKLSSAAGPLIFASAIALFGDIIGFNPGLAFRSAMMVLTGFLLLGFLILQKWVPNKHVEFKQKKSKLLNALNNL